MAAQPAFMLYREKRALFDLLTNEQLGKVIKAAMAYFDTGEAPPDMEQAETLVFATLKADIDRSMEQYQAICERNRANGQKGGRPPKEPEDLESRKQAAIQALRSYQ